MRLRRLRALPRTVTRTTITAVVMIALLVAVVTPRCVYGQMGVVKPQPLVMVHGLNSSGDTWNDASWQLEDLFIAKTYRPSLDSYRPYWLQGNALHDYVRKLGLPDTTILIGHSNGGIVSRVAAQFRPYKGVVTVATPHQGAPFAAQVVNHSLYYQMQDLEWLFGSVYNGVYLELMYQLPWWLLSSVDLVATGVEMMWYVLADCLYYLGYGAPVLQDMVPGSPLLTSLNSAAAITQEALRFERYGVTVMADGDVMGGPFRLFADANTAEWIVFDLAVVGSYLQVLADDWMWSIDFWDPWYWEKWDASQALFLLGIKMMHIPQWWCHTIGASMNGGCLRSDGILPYPTQGFPGKPALEYLVQGPSHMEATTSSVVINTVASILRDQLNVQSRP